MCFPAADQVIKELEAERRVDHRTNFADGSATLAVLPSRVPSPINIGMSFG
jgi:hypothetical protein